MEGVWRMDPSLEYSMLEWSCGHRSIAHTTDENVEDRKTIPTARKKKLMSYQSKLI